MHGKTEPMKGKIKMVIKRNKKFSDYSYEINNDFINRIEKTRELKNKSNKIRNSLVGAAGGSIAGLGLVDHFIKGATRNKRVAGGIIGSAIGAGLSLGATSLYQNKKMKNFKKLTNKLREQHQKELEENIQKKKIANERGQQYFTKPELSLMNNWNNNKLNYLAGRSTAIVNASNKLWKQS